MVPRQWEICFILDGSLDWTVCFERQIPQTFFLALKKNITVDEAWDGLHKGERFFKRDLFEQERGSAMELWQIFKGISLNENKADQLMWEVDSKGKCTVKKVVFSLDCEVLWRIKRCGFLSFGSYAFQQRCNASYGCYSKMVYLQNAYLRDRGIPTVNEPLLVVSGLGWWHEPWFENGWLKGGNILSLQMEESSLHFYFMHCIQSEERLGGWSGEFKDGVGRLLGLIYGPLEWMGLFAAECKAVRRQKLVTGLPTDDTV
ncbi:hypothetical protein Gohar_003325 [Gossypium harknessii]|uniref:Uncharacterized protein n=1 Tax=Gossypium harknessii TaxID=34285 RepID=A0A7J9HP78_9ROSI|nr:hypothetical protein [Gossypium harknessii]